MLLQMHLRAWACITAAIRFSASALYGSGCPKVLPCSFVLAYALINGNSLVMFFITALFIVHFLSRMF